MGVGLGEAFVLLLVMIPLAGFVLLLALVFKIMQTLIGRQDRVRLSREEAEQLQRMWESLDRMEERIANLETILLQKEKEAPFDLHHHR